MKALAMALKGLQRSERRIHHSDRGCQYASHEYVQRVKQAGSKMSMTEKNHSAENAIAERVNGILKQEYWLDAEFATKPEARGAPRLLRVALCFWTLLVDLWIQERPVIKALRAGEMLVLAWGDGTDSRTFAATFAYGYPCSEWKPIGINRGRDASPGLASVARRWLSLEQ